MGQETVEGLAAANALLDALPSAAEQELIVELWLIGRDVLAAQHSLVPKETGELDASLSISVSVARLQARIGLISGKLSPFYGRIVEFGRRAQTVLVQRRRRVSGRLRLSRGRKRAEDIATSYTLHVKARAPRPYINPRQPDLETIAAERLAGFWSNTFARAGSTA